MDQLWTTSEVLLRPNRQKPLHYLAIVTSYPIKSSHNILLNLREFVKWSRKRNSMWKIDTNNDVFLATIASLGRDSTDRKCLYGVHPFYGTGPELLHIWKLMSSWMQSFLLSNKMNDLICQTSNKTYPHVSTVKLDVSISCGTPDLDAHAEEMGIPVVVFVEVNLICGADFREYSRSLESDVFAVKPTAETFWPMTTSQSNHVTIVYYVVKIYEWNALYFGGNEIRVPTTRSLWLAKGSPGFPKHRRQLGGNPRSLGAQDDVYLTRWLKNKYFPRTLLGFVKSKHFSRAGTHIF